MASQSNTELPPDQDVCHLCLVPVLGSKDAHEAGLYHQAARRIAATALDRWRAHMAASVLPDPVEDTTDADAADSVIFCDICTEAVPSTAFSRHLPSRSHLLSALDIQEFEEQVRLYVDDEDLELLETPERNGGDEPAAKKCDASITYTCHICGLQVPLAFKAEHERSVHHKTRVALASAAARRTSAYLHQTPIRVSKDNIKMSELLQTYAGIDLKKNKEEIKETVVKEVAPVVKKRLTSKKYFSDILPYLQYTEALYTLVIDDSEYVTIKNTNGTCMRVHVANFNGIYSDSGDGQNVRCRMCHGYQYISYNSEMDHDKLHVMSLGHIRHVLTPIDNVHGIRKIDYGQTLCVLCNVCMHEHNVGNHIFNDIHHTANLAEALKLGRSFRESKDDLKIVIYTPPTDKTNNMRNPIGFPHNHLYGGVNVCPPGKPQGGTLFGGGTASAGGFGANTVTIEGFGGNASAGDVAASTAGTTKRANPGALFSASPASTGFGVSTTDTGAIGVTMPKASVFGSTAGTGFGLSTSNTGLSLGASPAFGASPASTGFGATPASTGFGVSPASTGFGVSTANTGFSFGATPDSTGFGASTANNTTSTGFGVSTANTGTFGTGTGTTFGGTPKSGTIFGTTATAVTTNSASDDYKLSV